MDTTQHTFGQEEIHPLQDYRDKQRDGRLKIRAGTFDPRYTAC